MHSTSRFMTAALVAMLGSFLAGTSAMAAEMSFKTPVINGVGQIRSQPAQDLTYQPDVDKDYKAVFNLTRAAGEPDQVSQGLQHVARAVNLYAEANVPLERLDFVVVISGKATPVVLDNEHYRAKFGVDNPNLPVIEQLSKVGVDVVVCSQALAMLGYPDSGVDKHVRLALSALTAVIELQQEGYALVPL